MLDPKTITLCFSFSLIVGSKNWIYLLTHWSHQFGCVGLSMGLRAIGLCNWGYTLNNQSLINPDPTEFNHVR